MTYSKNKIVTILIATLLMISMSTSMIIFPTTNAHTPAWQIPTFAQVTAAPNPVGVGQQALVVMWIDKTPSGALLTNNLRWHNFQLTITKPDGTNTTMTFSTVSDPTSSAYTPYVPDQVGTYTFTFNFPQQLSPTTDIYQNDTYLASSASTTLTVQQDPIPIATTSYPLPTEYWTRPIEGQNTDWWSISSNWLGSGSPRFTGYGRVQPDGIAPNSGHIMWTKPLEYGGVVGGSDVGVNGQVFAMNQEYNSRFGNAIVMNGVIYYDLPYGNSGTGGGLVAVDLRTGEQIWWSNDTVIGSPSFGYLYDLEQPNQHGVLKDGLLFTSNFARSYNPDTGIVTTMNITNVPTGTLANGPSGEQLRYAVTNVGSASNPAWRLTQWNSSNVVGFLSGASLTSVSEWYTGTLPGNTPITPTASGTNTVWNGSMWVSNAIYTAQGYTTIVTNPAYDWNLTIPALNGLSAPTILCAVPGDFVFGTSSSFTTGTSSSVNFGTPSPYTFWAISIKPESLGNLLWIQNYTAPGTGNSNAANITLEQGAFDPASRVFTMYVKETGQYYGYSMDNGNTLWGPTATLGDVGTNAYDYYNFADPISKANPIHDGKLYYSGYGGILRCIDVHTGTLLWTYGNGAEGNSTYAGFNNAYGHYPLFIGVIADGKIYAYSAEHSPNTPIYKDVMVRCINATNGAEIWKELGYNSVNKFLGGMVEADGYLVYLNAYDDQIYCIGKGPSQLSVEAPKTSIELGRSLVISGMVTDIAAGTKQIEQAARFPNGVAAVSDKSQSAWMEYVYMQKPKPTDATGVQVSINVIDANGNNRNIGMATSDSSGAFSFQWTPDIQGKYTVIATFAGSQSYYPSSSETSFAVDPAAPTAAPTSTPATSTADTYLLPGIIAIIVVIAIVGAILALLVIKKRP